MPFDCRVLVPAKSESTRAQSLFGIRSFWYSALARKTQVVLPVLKSPREPGDRNPGSGSQTTENRLTGYRRWAILTIGIGGLVLGVLSHWRTGTTGEESFGSNSAFRVGVVMIAIWLALPTLNKPMRWLPPGAAVMCLIAVGAIAAQPRLVVIVVPAVGFLLTIGWLVRIFQVTRRR